MRERTVALIVLGALAGGFGACGDDGDEGASDAQKRSSSSAQSDAPVLAEARLGQPETVSAQANIFGAGREYPPGPGGGGVGVLPPGWRLPGGSHRIVTFAGTTGRVTPIVGTAPQNGPAGDGVGATNVNSWQGISGIVHRRNGMFLVGVFLTDDPPSGEAPPRLNFTKREGFKSLAPLIGQTFLVGDGKGRSYRVPSEATRLFLGFADGYYYRGHPGWYGNNDGELTVTAEMSRG